MVSHDLHRRKFGFRPQQGVEPALEADQLAALQAVRAVGDVRPAGPQPQALTLLNDPTFLEAAAMDDPDGPAGDPSAPSPYEPRNTK